MTRLSKLEMVLNLPPLDAATMEKYAWNPDDKSINITVKEDDPLTFKRSRAFRTTDCIRGKVGFSNGFHVWQITWPQKQRGTNAAVGVCTKEAPVMVRDYLSLIGNNADSFGWDLTQNICNHNGAYRPGWTYPMLDDVNPEDAKAFNVDDSFYCILDMDEGYMAFATDEQYLGVAFRGLEGMKLYPVVSAVYGDCEVTMKYIGGLDPEPRTLIDACRRTIHDRLGQNHLHRANELPLPSFLKRYIRSSDPASKPSPYHHVSNPMNQIEELFPFPKNLTILN